MLAGVLLRQSMFTSPILDVQIEMHRAAMGFYFDDQAQYTLGSTSCGF